MADNLSPAPSIYRQELTRGFQHLAFEGSLEKAFRAHMTAMGLVQLRIALAIGFVFGFTIAALDFFLAGPGFSNPSIPLRAAISQPLVLAMLVATFFQSTRRFLTPLGIAVGLSIGVGSLFLSSVAAEQGIGSTFTGYIMVTFYIYLFLGLRFWPATATSGALYVGYFALGLAEAQPAGALIYNGLFLSFANLIGATGLYNLEYSRRVSFLKEQELGFLATRDSLTGLANRQVFDEQLESIWAYCKREREPMAVVLIDVDHYKAYNDTYGHQAGDRCLVALADLIGRLGRRPLDVVARCGGEEFVVLLPGCSARHARALLEDMRFDLAERKLPHGASPTAGHITVSAGVAAVTPHNTRRSAQGLLQSADQALYEAKSAGRDRVVIAEADKLSTLETGKFQLLDEEPLIAQAH
jgi:diguanylate cyclase (GGDEF)-like protein